MEYKYNLDVDFDIPSDIVKIARIKQGDALARKFVVDLLKSGKPYTPAAGCTVTLRCEKSNGSAVEIRSGGIEGNRVSFSIAAIATNISGRCICDICLSDNDGVLSSESFIMFVHHSPGY